MESHVSQPVVVVLVCGYSVREVEPAADTGVRGRSRPASLSPRRDLHVPARGLEHRALGRVHNQDSGLLDRPQEPLLVPPLQVEGAGKRL